MLKMLNSNIKKLTNQMRPAKSDSWRLISRSSQPQLASGHLNMPSLERAFFSKNMVIRTGISTTSHR